MTNSQIEPPNLRKPLRLWPGVALLILQWLLWFVVPYFGPGALLYGVFGGVLCGLAIALWWLFLSRAPWLERVSALLLIVLALIGTKRIVHASIAGGSMGYLLYVIAIPVLSLALVVWAVASRRLPAAPRRAAMVASILLACGVFTLIRTGGLNSEFHNDFHWRWTKTPEERLLAQGGDEPTTLSAASTVPPAANTAADWPGFRGPQRNGVVHGVRIKTDWSASPPVEQTFPSVQV